MSRSYKKNPIAIIVSDKSFKKYFNKAVRKKPLSFDLHDYKKMYNSYNIVDFKSITTLNEFLKIKYDMYLMELRNYEWRLERYEAIMNTHDEFTKPYPTKKECRYVWENMTSKERYHACMLTSNDYWFVYYEHCVHKWEWEYGVCLDRIEKKERIQLPKKPVYDEELLKIKWFKEYKRK